MIEILLTSALSLLVNAPLTQVAPEREWTLLFYGASDNNSEESFVPDMRDAMRGLPLAGIDVLAFVDRSPKYSNSSAAFGEDFSDSRLFRLTAESCERLGGGEEFPEITVEGSYEANSGDARTLRKALRWAKEVSPAKNYGVIFYSHGGGDAWCPDESSGGDLLYPAELTDSLELQDSLDLMVFDVCSMACVENAYQWRPGTGKFGADIMVATPMAGYPFPWHDIFAQVAAVRSKGAPFSAKEFGGVVVDVVGKHRLEALAGEGQGAHAQGPFSYEAMGCFDLSEAQAVKQCTDRLARALAGLETSQDDLEGLRGFGEEVGLLHFMGASPERFWPRGPFFDLHDLARRVPEMETTSPELLQAARDLESAVDRMVVASFGMAGYERYDFLPGASGLSITFPDGQRHWKNFNWYTSSRLGEGKRGYGNYAWCADGALEQSEVGNWYQLLQSWYGAH
ncbi:MAG: clostripain [Candidatus Paceibacteria bacterium]|jgi:clostripain